MILLLKMLVKVKLAYIISYFPSKFMVSFSLVSYFIAAFSSSGIRILDYISGFHQVVSKHPGYIYIIIP